MNKLLIGGLAVAALALTGCTTVVEPEPTVNETVTPEPEIVVPEPEPAPDTSSSSLSSEDAMFDLMMRAVDTPNYLLEGETLRLLQDQAKDTCDYIDQGMNSDEITLALLLALDGSDADEDVKDAFMAATVASTYSYCTEYEGFWD